MADAFKMLTDENLKKQLESMDPTDLETLLKQVVAHPPVVEEKAATSQYPYYHKLYGDTFIVLVDKLLKNPEEDIIFDGRKMANRVKGETIRRQITQGWQWVIDKHPDPLIRQRFLEYKVNSMIQLAKNGFVVRMFLTKHAGTAGDLVALAKTVPSINKERDWRQEIINFAKESSTGESLKLTDMFFNAEELNFIKEYFDELNNSLGVCFYIKRLDPKLIHIINVKDNDED